MQIQTSTLFCIVTLSMFLATISCTEHVEDKIFDENDVEWTTDILYSAFDVYTWSNTKLPSSLDDLISTIHNDSIINRLHEIHEDGKIVISPPNEEGMIRLFITDLTNFQMPSDWMQRPLLFGAALPDFCWRIPAQRIVVHKDGNWDELHSAEYQSLCSEIIIDDPLWKGNLVFWVKQEKGEITLRRLCPTENSDGPHDFQFTSIGNDNLKTTLSNCDSLLFLTTIGW